VNALPASIARRITIDPAGCWIVAAKPGRWGHVKIGGRSAARVVWELLIGLVDPELVLDHREDLGCTSKACVYPGHLLPVTQQENSTRVGACGFAAMNARKTCCGTCGAPYNMSNTYRYGTRCDCRRCRRRRVAEYKARQRAVQAGSPILHATPGNTRTGLGRAA
jgi:hypothetical protein